MTDINKHSRRKFLAGMVKAGAMLPFATQLLEQNAFAADTGYTNLLFIYHPNGLHHEHWAPKFSGPINTSDELSFGLGELKPYHNNMIVLKNIYVNIQDGGNGDGAEGGGHFNAMRGCLSGNYNDNSIPSIDHLIAEKLPGKKGVLSLGVRTGSASQQILSKPRGVTSGQVQPPNNDPADVASKLSAKVNPVPGSPLQTKVYAAAIADLDALPKLDNVKSKITQHQNALIGLQKNQSVGELKFPFNPKNVKEIMETGKDFGAYPERKTELIKLFPEVCRAQIDNAVAAFANGLHNVATLQLSTCDENSGRVLYSFDECWEMSKLAKERGAGDNLTQRPENLDNNSFASHGPSHEVNNCNFQGQVRWHFSLVKYALDQLKEKGILDKTLVVTVSDEGNYSHDLRYGGIVVAGGSGNGLSMGRVIDCGSNQGNGTHKLFGDIARWMNAPINEGLWKSGII